MKQLIAIISIFIVMTTNINAQSNQQLSQDERLIYFQNTIEIPDAYHFKRVTPIEVDKVKAHLYRYEKDHNQGMGREHFSFIVTDAKPYKILGFTQMDAKFSSEKEQLSKNETEQLAKDFLKKIDAELDKSLSNLWVDVHDEIILVDGQEHIVRGMKYKCYRKVNDDYVWVIVAKDGTIITYERDIFSIIFHCSLLRNELVLDMHQFFLHIRLWFRWVTSQKGCYILNLLVRMKWLRLVVGCWGNSILVKELVHPISHQ